MLSTPLDPCNPNDLNNGRCADIIVRRHWRTRSRKNVRPHVERRCFHLIYRYVMYIYI